MAMTLIIRFCILDNSRKAFQMKKASLKQSLNVKMIIKINLDLSLLITFVTRKTFYSLLIKKGILNSLTGIKIIF